ncbi:MAG: nicotinate-nicotinamide nucleotide adenylyltransferase [Phycisphaerales bacterium]|nr:nicotinate-nicotinamide nucleotide adenylyltransferase [Planctomycetota bacterium]
MHSDARSPEAPITPLPRGLSHTASQIILIGGTFDPPHLAHTELAVEARRLAGSPGAFLLFVPAAQSPLKSAAPGASTPHRLEMLRLAIEGIPQSALWTDEIDRAAAHPGVPSFTIDTIRRLRSLLGQCANLRLLIGADQAAGFHRWREPDAIIDLAPPLVMLRGSESSTPHLLRTLSATGRWSEKQLETWQRSIIATPLRDISSTQVRDLLRESPSSSTSTDPLTSVAPQVLQYIRNHRLYQSPPS